MIYNCMAAEWPVWMLEVSWRSSLADAASPEFHPLIRDAKDVAAGAVLVTAIAAVVIGSIIFWPYMERLF